jgi:transposase
LGYPPELRLRVVREVLDGQMSRAGALRVFGVAVTTIAGWLQRYREKGAEGLKAERRGPSPRTQPGSAVKRELVTAMRREHPQFGTQRVSDMLRRFEGLGVSQTEVRRILHEAGLMPEQPEHTPAREHLPRRFERAEPNQLWQSDIFTFLLRRHERLYLCCFMDDHPWFTGFSSPPDEDGDGFPEIYGRVADDAIGATQDIVSFIRSDYEGRVLSPAEVKAWAHQLASYWYPSYNTDLVGTPATWPATDTEASVRGELGNLSFTAPTVVMRGKPQGKPVYNVFLVDSGANENAASPEPGKETVLNLGRSKPAPAPAEVKNAVLAELAAHGGSWSAWLAEVAALHAALKRRVDAMPAGSKAMAGSDGFLFFRQSLAYVLGGDLAKQQGDRNPIPAIVSFKKLLAKQGVDFLFVPVPTKEEIFPDKTGVAPGDSKLAPFAGKVVNPFARKFLVDLADQGVETIDLLPAFLAERQAGKGERLYQAQDTHWTTRGLELAAEIVAKRIKRFSWYKGISAHRRIFSTKDEPFTRHGDLVSRLPEGERGKLVPETLVGHQVVNADGSLYEDDPDSPVVVLGDSFTGVFQLMDCEHAGVSAHLAKEIGYPVDLLMSYGGGPNVREKLLRRGVDKLGSKKLVIWMMTARDLYDHAEGWPRTDKK